MSTPRLPLFLERQSYRRRRLVDASRAIPVFGIILFFVPLLWQQPEPGEAPGLAQRGIYLFLAWGLLVAVTAVISIRLQTRLHEGARQNGPAEGTDVL
ncbi:hypothetical protein [Mangrovicoccus sp. HB161399]|uniref:hypothetical protein n=1 Tax=Mangrovicoccus sp. HB161399 TaxID=2720392 RepID=UPI001C1314AD|nr:hypothetical protein [Mangrovicoccus sp. HB161399]